MFSFFKRLYQAIRSEILDTEKIQRAQFPIIMVPFHGVPVPIMVRELTQAQIVACGEFSLIETFQDKINKKSAGDKRDMIKIAEFADLHHAICKRALVKPTYDEIIEAITCRPVIDAREIGDRLKKKLDETPMGEERAKLEREIDELMIWTDLLLPDDFTAAVVSYSLGIEKSDIRELTEEALIQAAILAERGHDNPADHIGGKFTDFMRDDINIRGWLLLHEQRDKTRMKHRAG